MTEAPRFEEFVRARSAALLRYGYVLTGNAHDAEDLVQEALVRLRGAWSRVRDQHDPEGYVRTTMARLHVSRWRRLRRERLVDDVPERGYTDEALARADADVGLWQALGELPRRQRAVLVLRHYEGLDDTRIAEVLGITRGTVRSQAARGLDKLRAGRRFDDTATAPSAATAPSSSAAAASPERPRTGPGPGIRPTTPGTVPTSTP